MTDTRPPWHDHPQVGPAGFTEEETDYGKILFLRSPSGELLGTIEFYVKTRDIGIPTSAWHLRRGVMSRMLDEARVRWPTLDIRKQNYNRGGQAFIQKYLERRNELKTE